MYWEITYCYKHHVGVQVMSVDGNTEAQARSMFYFIRPKEVGWRIVSVKPH